MVERSVAVDGGQHAERDADGHGDDETGQRELQGSRDALPEVFEDGAAGRGALAEVAAEEAGHVAPVLDGHGSVEPHPALDLRHVLGVGERPRLDEAGLPGSR